MYVPPRPLKKVMPNGTYPEQLPVIYETTQVAVQVNIDATGRVTDAHAVENGGKANLRLASGAVSAAKQWRFEPATIHGKPIASEHMLVFVFRPSSQ
jgi:TonB family protein